jgi:hypothetical protein
MRGAVVVLLCLLSVKPLAAKTARALLIGINLYTGDSAPAETASAPVDELRPSQHRGGRARDSYINLDGCINDVKHFRALLVSRFGFAPGNITVLEDRDATREAILASIRKHLVEEAAPGDIAVFYFAGHGSQAPNPASREVDRKDETIVPADSWRGARDIHDKELSRAFNAVLDKHVQLTAIFDSCHSGSIGRGLPREEKQRSLPMDPRPLVDEGTRVVAPEERGALILWAAQNDQSAGEQSVPDPASGKRQEFGRFSLALVATLKTCPVAMPAGQILQQIRARMQSEGSVQEPGSAGTGRLNLPLFGQGTSELSGKTTVAVARVWADDNVVLDAGSAAGLVPGCILRRQTTADAKNAARLKISQVEGLGRSQAVVIQKDKLEIKNADLFEVERWGPRAHTRLPIFLPPPLEKKTLSRLLDALNPLRSSPKLHWVEDPTQDETTHLLTYGPSSWKLRALMGPGNSAIDVGSDPKAAAILRQLESSTKRLPRLFISWPPSAELAAEFAKLQETNTIDLVAEMAKAQYVLMGRAAGPALTYAFVQPGAGGAGHASPLPARTHWSPPIAKDLMEVVRRLSRVKGWLQLDPGPDSPYFPYHLELIHQKTGQIHTTGPLVVGDVVDLALKTSRVELGRPFVPQFVYVLALDSDGAGTLLFPVSGAGAGENRLPHGVSRQDDYPLEIRLRSGIVMGEPAGTDTLILITSDTPLPDPNVLNFDGVRSRGETVNWSIQRRSYVTVPKPH